MRKKTTIRSLTLTALFMALNCVATMVIHIPTVAGYVNLGDGMVLLGTCFLGPLYGFAAGGVGPMLADLLMGYTAYMPATFLVKGILAVLFAGVLGRFSRRNEPRIWMLILAGVISEAWMVLGYWMYDAWLLGNPAAATGGIPGNAAQGLAGVVVCTVLYSVLCRVPEIKKYLVKE